MARGNRSSIFAYVAPFCPMAASIFLSLSCLRPTFIYLDKHFAAIGCSSTSPKHNLGLSSLVLKPKWRDKNYHMVLCRAAGLETPNRPLSESLSSSSSVNERVAFDLLPLEALWTKLFRLAARTLRDISNSLCTRILNGDFPSERNL